MLESWSLEVSHYPSTGHETTINVSVTEGYKIKIDSSVQYGQKNAQGDMRFLVLHDQERKPFQHRFLETALGSTGAAKAKEIAAKFGQGDIAGTVTDLAKNFVGDYLRTF